VQPRADAWEDFGLSGLTKVLQSRFSPRDEAGCLALTERVPEVEGRP
jgi:hypothetical protein